MFLVFKKSFHSHLDHFLIHTHHPQTTDTVAKSLRDPHTTFIYFHSYISLQIWIRTIGCQRKCWTTQNKRNKNALKTQWKGNIQRCQYNTVVKGGFKDTLAIWWHLWRMRLDLKKLLNSLWFASEKMSVIKILWQTVELVLTLFITSPSLQGRHD